MSKVMRIAHLKAFWSLKIGLTGMGTNIIQMTAKTIAQLTFKLISSNKIALSIRNAQTSWMWALFQMFPYWLGQHGCAKTG
jgi:hypothetical protein